ncbi:prealbumin-like fold domain-containing protein [Conexibacter woesei]|uniref:prealbumin-like fold domain-containing protein n=1 Tax=Conexibacter woesei TaxID=191495 RepID=UPI0002F6C2D2|nr:DUF11 domain-containing protein [Conexibacter woesei]
MGVAAIIAAIVSVSGGSAGAQQVGPSEPDGRGTDVFVTIAARECDEYTDIRANLARNNIMESLQDLGDDTLYSSGDQIDPRTEQAGQPACRPLVGWRFTFGSSYQTRAVTGVWGALSKVLNPDDMSIVTQGSVPARGYQGETIAGQRIAAATTIELSADQLSRSPGNALWLQGGEPEDPVLYQDPRFAGRYGFGALRCAIDDLNGDNVETVQFPSGVRHVFCYAYYVTPPPSSGTIVIRKEVRGANATSETFGYGGNISYNAGGAFDLTAGPDRPDSITFFRAETRAGDPPWTAVENVPAGWALTGIECSNGASVVATDLAARRVSIQLAAGDTVTCTYVNRPQPVRAGLLVRKITEGGVGSFDFRVRDANGGRTIGSRAIRTTREGVPAGSGPLTIQPGRYELSERLPVSPLGVWRRVGASCNDSNFGAEEAVLGAVESGSGTICTFTNRLVMPGKITLRKETLGGTGTAAFVVSPYEDPTIQRRQLATTSRQGQAVRARGQSLDDLPFGRYVIQESAARTQDRGDWSLLAVVCDRRLVPFSQGRAVVRLTRTDPETDCRFVNVRHPTPRPPGPGPGPGPDPVDPPGPDPVPGGDRSDLTVEKRLVSTTPGLQPVDTWRVTVSNEGSVSAANVAVGDQIIGAARFLTARTAGGSCSVQARVLYCSLGGLRAGADTTVTVRVLRTDQRTWTNVATVGSGSPEAATGDNTARVRVEGARRSNPGACAAAGPLATIAC